MANILVIDDDPDIGSMLAVTLSSAGHDVVTVEDPRRAVDVIAGSRFDAVVLDVMMPGLSGWDLLERLRADPATRRLPLVMLSALDSASNRVRGLRGGADDYMGKPFEPVELVARIERLLHRVEGSIPSLQGRLEDCGLLEMTQTLEQNRKSGDLLIDSKGSTGVIRLHRGKPIEAKIDRLSGEAALRAMVELEHGSFRFEVGSDEQAAPAESDLSFQHVGMDVAWLRDELHRRREWLPDSNAPLALINSEIDQDALPENFAALPIEGIVEALNSRAEPADEQAGRTTLQDLLDLGLDAPTSTRLAVAWLVEEGLVAARSDSEVAEEPEAVSTAEPGELSIEAGDEWLSESLDMALRELFQLAVLYELPIDPVDVVHLVDPDAWGLLWPLLQRLPSQVLGPNGSASRMRLLAEKRGSLQIQHSSGCLRLCFETVRGEEIPKTLPSRAAGVILWLPSALEGYSLPAAAKQMESGSREATPLLVVSSERDRSTAAAIVAKERGWRLVTKNLADLEGLVTELALVEAT